jgi:hypothetical protein
MRVELAEALRAAIEAAWKDAQYPNDRRVSAGYDNEDLVRRAFVGKHWHDVNPDQRTLLFKQCSDHCHSATTSRHAHGRLRSCLLSARACSLVWSMPSQYLERCGR